MTLQNLKRALHINNLILLGKIKQDSHQHENMTLLDDLSDKDGRLHYKGESVVPMVTDEEVQQAITDTLKILKNKEE